MKQLIKQELDKYSQPQLKKLVLAEFLQHLILQSLYSLNAFKNLTFTGGTALRLLYGIKRFSEDLDFSFFKSSKTNLSETIESVIKDINLQGIKLESYTNDERTVFKSDLRFPGILNELGLSPLKDQKITIKFEVDKNPPKGGEREILLVNHPVSYTVSVFSLSSMFATKLHAVFYRKYTKGRDYYDLGWYLGKKIKPNFTLLNNAIKQTQGEIPKITEENLKEILIKHLESVDFKNVKNDVERFLINPKELDFLTLESIKSLLRNY